jgi:hypothetical protein
MFGIALLAGLVALLVQRAALAQTGDMNQQPWFPMVDARKGPSETFELNTLEVIHVGEEGWRANRGKYRESLTRHDFFVTIGRPDLAAKDRSASARSSTLTWLGLGAVAAGGVMTFFRMSSGGWDPPIAVGLGLVGAGALSIYIGSKIGGPVITPEEADGFARRYNEQLKAHIEREMGTPRPVQVRLLKPRIVPWTDGRAGGLIAMATF